MERKVTIQDFIDSLGMAGLLTSVGGEPACSAVMAFYTEPAMKELGECEVKAVTYNSKEAAEGTLFVVKGAHFREQYLNDAIEKGAVCYVREDPDAPETAGCRVVSDEEAAAAGKRIKEKAETSCLDVWVRDVRKAMPVIAETFYGRLSDDLRMVGITGTKGKSTTTYYMRYILDDWLGYEGKGRSAVCSGIYNYDGVIDEESHLTTPEILELYTHMDNALRSGIHYLSMEVSSQALKYDRVDGVTFEAGAFLNIGTDHISEIEHPDFNDYLESKLRLFAQCRKAAINLDCDEQERIRAAAEACPYVIAFSQKDETANIYGYDIKSVEGKVTMKVRCTDVEGWNDFDEEFTLGTFGTINVENALAAISIATLLGVPREYIHSGLERATSPGRMEVFYSEDGKRIAIVDYAHNKLSYEKFFDTIKDEFPDKKMMIVFGCPGGKAFARREELGTIAGQNCVYSIITEEDYGEEDVNKICEEIAGFVRAAGGECEIITDRVEAIKKAITLMDDDTILFLPGKGRETREKRGIQYIDTPSDADVVLEYL